MASNRAYLQSASSRTGFPANAYSSSATNAAAVVHRNKGDIRVHPGFLRYYRHLEAVMDTVKMKNTPLLKDLSRSSDEDSLRTWLYSGNWEFCVFTGQSLGAAEAQIAALLTSQLSHKRPYLVTFATPIVCLAGIPDPDQTAPGSMCRLRPHFGA